MNVDLCVRFNDEIKHLRNTILQGRKHYRMLLCVVCYHLSTTFFVYKLLRGLFVFSAPRVGDCLSFDFTGMASLIQTRPSSPHEPGHIASVATSRRSHGTNNPPFPLGR